MASHTVDVHAMAQGVARRIGGKGSEKATTSIPCLRASGRRFVHAQAAGQVDTAQPGLRKYSISDGLAPVSARVSASCGMIAA
ncbi:MAG: hypothetical protein IPG25_19360 [Proteobacteria bacterium]|nr:hypothetical protein [Pseudomonadota bacterium]